MKLVVLWLCMLSCTALAEDVPPVVLAPDAPPAAVGEQPPLIAQPDLAFASTSDPNPGSGAAQITAGWIATGIGAGGVLHLTACFLDINDYDMGEQRRCRNIGIGLSAFLALGVPWLTFGYQKLRAQRAWKKRHGLAFDVTPDAVHVRYAF